MAFEGEQLKGVGLKAAADLSAKQFYAVVVSGDSAVNLAGANAACVMVLQNKPVAGDPAEVCVIGTTKAYLGGTVAAGDLVAANANGEFILADSGKQAVGRCVVGGGSGNYGTIILGGVGETQ